MAKLKNNNVSSSIILSPAPRKASSFLKIGIIYGCIAFVLAVTITAFALSPLQNPQPDTQKNGDVLVIPDNVDGTLTQLQGANSDSSYTPSMNIDWYFEHGASPSSNAYVENVSENSNTVYFEVLLANTGEIVYSSPYIPVGSILEHPTLTVDLDAGTYSGICVYHLVDNNNNELSTVSAAVTLHILN